MANFVSSLTGQQINDVMTKIDQGVPEGYAVGEKNGVPVSSSSVYYHNNAKYYAESAQGSAARAEAAVPASTAGAVFFDRSQSLTEAQKGQAKANIGAGGTNPNILENWYFASAGVVNQRGNTTGTFGNNLPVVDRWFSTFYTSGDNSSWTLTSDGLQLTLASDANVILKQQYNPIIPGLVGKTLIASVELSDGSVYSSAPFVRTSASQSEYIISAQIRVSIRDDNVVWFQFFSAANGLTIKAVKLEVGTVSTLANDAPPNYADELLKCQRYFRRLTVSAGTICALGIATNATTVYFPNVYNTPRMSRTPSITYTGALNARLVRTTTNVAISALAIRYDPPNISIVATISGTATVGDVYGLILGANAHIDITADIDKA